MEIRDAFEELAEAVKRLVQYRIKLYGINPKTGTNTLQGSELEKSLSVDTTEDGITLQIADYWQFVSRGWKRTGNYPGTMSQFIHNVNDWVRRKNIRFGNLHQSVIVYTIVNNIMRNGLKPRPFMVYDDDGDLTKMIPELNDYMDKWFDRLFELIITDLDKYFNE